MTNTLTWNIKPINTNLLSVISLVVLCMMVFVTINAFAFHCGDLEKSQNAAKLAADAAIWLLEQAGKALNLAHATENDFLINIAQEAFDAAKAIADAALAYRAERVKAYLNCLKSHNNMADSGSCDSGSNS